MKRMTITAVGVIFSLCAVHAALAQTDNTFQVSSGFWDDTTNWDQGHKPQPGERAVIPSSGTCYIGADDHEEADQFHIEGVLVIPHNGSLTITEDSTIEGTISLQGGGQTSRASLLVGADLTITGDGGVIDMVKGSLIDDDGTDTHTLTLAGSCTGSAQRSCSLVVHGHGHIRATLVNDAFVVADTDYNCGGRGGDCFLRLMENSKSGSGYWIAESAGGPPGWLYVEAETSGSGTWLLVSDEEAKIKIDACTSVSGNVLVTHGIFDVDDDFCTTGVLTFDSVGATPTSPVIDVAASATAEFGVSACSACP